MKAIVILFALLAVIGIVVASDWGGQQPCDPDGDGKPGCCRQIGKHRNNWDDAAYWECSVVGGCPTRGRCPGQQLFDPRQRRCVPRKDYVWIPPCTV